MEKCNNNYFKMRKFSDLSYKYHVLFALILRIILVIYSEFHDKISEVPYTDIDYRVFTDASRHILNNNSPYDRHTYRYTPFIAILLIPNLIFYGSFGKILFSIIDIAVGLLIRTIVRHNRLKFSVFKNAVTKKSETFNEKENQNSENMCRLRKKSIKNIPKLKKDQKSHKLEDETCNKIANYCMLFWIYNPMTFIISTRGNCDAIAAFLVLLTLYFLQCKETYFLAGLVHGLAIHVRLYPIMYSLSYFMYLSNFGQYSIDKRVTHASSQKVLFQKQIKQSPADEITTKNCETNLTRIDPSQNQKLHKTIFKIDYLYYLIPNYNQLAIISGTLISLTILTSVFYYLYGYEFLYETYIFHLVRKDTRHNFSLFFYIQYLTAGIKNIGIWQKVLSILPQLVLLLVLSVRYGLNKFTLPFSILTQTIVMVAYNSVLTSQYFVWILAILPLTLWQFEMTLKSSLILVFIWFAAQVAWLLPAYLLEFHGQNMFLFIWLQSVSFFCANMAILGRLIKCYMYKVE